MHDFLRFFKEKVKSYPMHLEIYYSKITDWTINIYKKGCAEDGGNLHICYVQNPDVEYAFAEAHVKLKEWLLEHEGGY